MVRATDLGLWGIVAIAIWGFALVSGVITPLLPSGLFAGLHATRLDGGNLNALRDQVADLEARAAKLSADNAELLQRVALLTSTSVDATKRLGALELSVPKVVEAVNDARRQGADATVTGSIGTIAAPGPAADGTRIATTPLATGQATVAPNQAMPAPLVATADSAAGSYGIALGPPILAMDGPAAWRGMMSEAGTLLVGLSPILGTLEGSGQMRLVAGPLPSEAAARELCGGMARLGVACASVPYVGAPISAN